MNTSLGDVRSAMLHANELLNNTDNMNSVTPPSQNFTPGMLYPQRSESPAANNVYLDGQQNLGHVIMDIYNRLEKLSVLDDICSRLTNIEKKFEGIQMEVGALKGKVDRNSDRIQRIEQDSAELQDDFRFFEQDKEELYRITRELKEDVLDVQTRSMRDNLLFGGVSRVLKTNENGNEYDDTEDVLKQFLHKEMNKQDDVSFERVHRMGKPRNGKPPFIVAKFTSHKQREQVRRKAATALRGKDHLSVLEQFSKEIQERRKRLIPKMKAAKRNG